MEMSRNQHAAIARAYLNRMNYADLATLAVQARVSTDAQLNGNNSAQLDAQDDFNAALDAAIGNIDELDLARVEDVIRRYTPAKVIPDGYWLIWSNEHNAWWRPGRCGYTQDEKQAGRYSMAEAVDICSKAGDGRMNLHPNGKIPPEIPVPAPELAIYLKDGRPAEEIMREALAITRFEKSDQADITHILHAFRMIAGLYIPDVVFDGYRVYESLQHTNPPRTTPENVSDVLDAIARLMKEDAKK